MARGRLLVLSPAVETPKSLDVELKETASEDTGLSFYEHGETVDIDISAILGVYLKEPTSAGVLFLRQKDDSQESAEADKAQLCVLETQVDSLNLPKHLHFAAVQALGSEAQGHIIISVLSGKHYASGFYDNVVAPLLSYLDLGSHYYVHKTTSATSVIELTKSTIIPAAKEGKDQHIALLSGDGGIVDVVNELLAPTDLMMGPYKPPVVSLVAMGTGNALAHSTKVFDRTFGLSSWLRGSPKNLPLFRTEFSAKGSGAKLLSDEGRHQEDLPVRTRTESYFWGAVVFSWGFHAQIVADSDTPEFRKHGVERFKMAAQEALYPSDGSGPHKYRGRVTVERRDENNVMSWETIETNEHCYVLGTMVSNLEEHFKISPGSVPLDGNMKLVHIKHLDGDAIMRIMGLAYKNGKHIEDPDVEYLDVDGFTVQFEENEDKWRRVCIDGQIILVEQGGTVRVVRETRNTLQLTSLI